MRRTLTTSVATLLLAIPAPALADCTEPGKALWSIKSNVPRGASITRAPMVPLAGLMNLPDPEPVPSPGKLLRPRIPHFDNALGIQEGELVRTRGWLRLIATEDNDCEYHLQLTLSATSTRSFIIEVAKDDATSIRSAWVRSKAGKVRAFVRDEVNGGKEPPEGGKTLADPLYVEVVGQLFYDSAHGKNDKRGKAGMPAATLWELHPVVEIKASRAPR